MCTLTMMFECAHFFILLTSLGCEKNISTFAFCKGNILNLLVVPLWEPEFLTCEFAQDFVGGQMECMCSIHCKHPLDML